MDGRSAWNKDLRPDTGSDKLFSGASQTLGHGSETSSSFAESEFSGPSTDFWHDSTNALATGFPIHGDDMPQEDRVAAFRASSEVELQQHTSHSQLKQKWSAQELERLIQFCRGLTCLSDPATTAQGLKQILPNRSLNAIQQKATSLAEKGV